MPFEELVAGLNGKMLLAATNVFDRKKSTLYIFDGKDTKRIQDILAAERAYVEKKKKGHSLPRLFKKNGVSFESVAVPIEHIIVWDREEETPEAAEPVVDAKKKPLITDDPMEAVRKLAKAKKVIRRARGRKQRGDHPLAGVGYYMWENGIAYDGQANELRELYNATRRIR